MGEVLTQDPSQTGQEGEFKGYDFKESVLPDADMQRLIRYRRRLFGTGPELSSEERGDFLSLQTREEQAQAEKQANFREATNAAVWREEPRDDQPIENPAHHRN